MEIDVHALQRLPEASEVGLQKPKCLPDTSTKVICGPKSCKKTIIVIVEAV